MPFDVIFISDFFRPVRAPFRAAMRSVYFGYSLFSPRSLPLNGSMNMPAFLGGGGLSLARRFCFFPPLSSGSSGSPTVIINFSPRSSACISISRTDGCAFVTISAISAHISPALLADGSASRACLPPRSARAARPFGLRPEKTQSFQLPLLYCIPKMRVPSTDYNGIPKYILLHIG